MKGHADIIDAPFHDPKTDYQFNEGSYFQPQFKIVGFFVLIAGITLCTTFNPLGIVLVILGIAVLFAKKILTISFSLSRYRNSFSIFGFRTGQWITLPEFESISIFNAKKGQTMSYESMSATASYSELEVNLVYNRSRRLTVYTTKDYNKALDVARKFAIKFDLSIYDASARDGKWLDENPL